MAEVKEWQAGKRTRAARKQNLAERQREKLKPSLSSIWSVGRAQRREKGMRSERKIPRRRGCYLLV